MIAVANKNLTNNATELSAKESLLSDIKSVKKILNEEFALSRPRIAIASTMSEEPQTIKSVVQQMQSQLQLIYGPFEIKDFFDSAKDQNFDATLLITGNPEETNEELFNNYHFKYLAGLDKVVTVPSFTAHAKTQKSEILYVTSFYEAYFSTLKLIKNRKTFEELTKNTLKIQSKKLMHHRDRN